MRGAIRLAACYAFKKWSMLLREPASAPADQDSGAQSALWRQIDRAPASFSPSESTARMQEWLTEMAGVQSGAAIAFFCDANPALRRLIEAVADGSPFLWDLLRRSPERLVAVLEDEPERRFD